MTGVQTKPHHYGHRNRVFQNLDFDCDDSFDLDDIQSAEMLKDSFLQPFGCHDKFIKNSFIDPDNISSPESEPEIIRITKDFDLKAILTEQLQTNSDTEKKYALTEFSCALSWKRNFLPVQNPHI